MHEEVIIENVEHLDKNDSVYKNGMLFMWYCDNVTITKIFRIYIA